ncbi:MAG TPA: pyridoxal-phosphate dependent enzyme [Cyclobacteriaceae bacterium]|nr:pyridoxal-phosphate dependent enzyme [Cyclobacteriaceae bacterium]
MISANTILEAHERIKPFITNTPVLTSEGMDEALGCAVYFKCENLQKIGAFKARGAMNAILSLSPEERRNGVATHSSGNHGQAVARAAKLLGIKAYIVMPRTVAEVKRNGVLSYGGIILECEPTIESRESVLGKVIEETHAVEIHPFNNYEVIAGQATAAKELIDEVPSLDYILAPVGGGGLISGTALAVKYFSPATKVVAGEPEGADDAYRSMKSGKIEPSQSDTIADGLLTKLGDKTFAIIREGVEEIITVNDEEIVQAMRMVWEKLKIIIEPSSAVPVAAVLKRRDKFYDKKIGIIFTGGNVDLEKALEYFRNSERAVVH